MSSLNSIGHSVFELESGNGNVDGQTDVGHMNLIGRLVTHNPPKNTDPQVHISCQKQSFLYCHFVPTGIILIHLKYPSMLCDYKKVLFIVYF